MPPTVAKRCVGARVRHVRPPEWMDREERGSHHGVKVNVVGSIGEVDFSVEKDKVGRTNL